YGKLGDTLGRKPVFQAAIVIFLAGSLLSGAAQSLDQLILFRAVQGAGAGGLMVGAQAIIGDIVPPRERGRYMGFIGSVFAVSSVAGPLLGGFFVDNLSWRWGFYVNIPVGLIAGLAMFGAPTFLPLYLQVVRGASPTTSGLLLVPLMAGLLTASIGSGRWISNHGRYRWFPITGTAILAVGMTLLTQLGVHT